METTLFVFHSMGMPIQITYEGEEDGILQTQIAHCFDALDAQFSTYKKTSDISKFVANKLPSAEQNALFKSVATTCEEWKRKTDGAFDANYSGSYDPSGYIKALAIQQTSKLLIAAGVAHYIVNASGDILTASNSKKTWTIGLQHPKNKRMHIGTIEVRNLAIASSGTYERGAHIVNPKTGKPVRTMLGLTVIGEDIVTADILATAAFASEYEWMHLIRHFDGYEALAILNDGTIQMTDGFSALVS